MREYDVSSEPVFISPVPLSLRWNRTTRTIARWRQQGLLPPPELYLGQQPAWSMETIHKVEEEMRQRAVECPPSFPNMGKAHAAVAAKRAQLAEREEQATPKVIEPTRKAARPTRSTRSTRRGA